MSGAGRSQQELVRHVGAIRDSWEQALRARRGRPVRSDAVAWRVLGLLPPLLVLTSGTVAAELAVTSKAAADALRTLADVGVLTEYGTAPQAGAGRPSRLYVSQDLLALTGSDPLR